MRVRVCRYGKLGASEAEVAAVARVVKLDSFFTTLPKGYHTIIGESTRAQAQQARAYKHECTHTDTQPHT